MKIISTTEEKLAKINAFTGNKIYLTERGIYFDNGEKLVLYDGLSHENFDATLLSATAPKIQYNGQHYINITEKKHYIAVNNQWKSVTSDAKDGLDYDDTAVKKLIKTNTDNIAINTTNIETNTTNIAENTANIQIIQDTKQDKLKQGYGIKIENITGTTDKSIRYYDIKAIVLENQKEPTAEQSAEDILYACIYQDGPEALDTHYELIVYPMDKNGEVMTRDYLFTEESVKFSVWLHALDDSLTINVEPHNVEIVADDPTLNLGTYDLQRNIFTAGTAVGSGKLIFSWNYTGNISGKPYTAYAIINGNIIKYWLRATIDSNEDQSAVFDVLQGLLTMNTNATANIKIEVNDGKTLKQVHDYTAVLLPEDIGVYTIQESMPKDKFVASGTPQTGTIVFNWIYDNDKTLTHSISVNIKEVKTAYTLAIEPTTQSWRNYQSVVYKIITNAPIYTLFDMSPRFTFSDDRQGNITVTNENPSANIPEGVLGYESFGTLFRVSVTDSDGVKQAQADHHYEYSAYTLTFSKDSSTLTGTNIDTVTVSGTTPEWKIVSFPDNLIQVVRNGDIINITCRNITGSGAIKISYLKDDNPKGDIWDEKEITITTKADSDSGSGGGTDQGGGTGGDENQMCALTNPFTIVIDKTQSDRYGGLNVSTNQCSIYTPGVKGVQSNDFTLSDDDILYLVTGGSPHTDIVRTQNVGGATNYIGYFKWKGYSNVYDSFKINECDGSQFTITKNIYNGTSFDLSEITTNPKFRTFNGSIIWPIYGYENNDMIIGYIYITTMNTFTKSGIGLTSDAFNYGTSFSVALYPAGTAYSFYTINKTYLLGRLGKTKTSPCYNIQLSTSSQTYEMYFGKTNIISIGKGTAANSIEILIEKTGFAPWLKHSEDLSVFNDERLYFQYNYKWLNNNIVWLDLSSGVRNFNHSYEIVLNNSYKKEDTISLDTAAIGYTDDNGQAVKGQYSKPLYISLDYKYSTDTSKVYSLVLQSEFYQYITDWDNITISPWIISDSLGGIVNAKYSSYKKEYIYTAYKNYMNSITRQSTAELPNYNTNEVEYKES